MTAGPAMTPHGSGLPTHLPKRFPGRMGEDGALESLEHEAFFDSL